MAKYGRILAITEERLNQVLAGNDTVVEAAEARFYPDLTDQDAVALAKQLRGKRNVAGDPKVQRLAFKIVAVLENRLGVTLWDEPDLEIDLYENKLNDKFYLRAKTENATLATSLSLPEVVEGDNYPIYNVT